MLNVRTAGKAYENFIVNAIYAKLAEPELMPVTQQYVRNRQGGYYLLDLYFPQLNYGIEVDEGHHLKDNQIKRDMIRDVEILNAIDCEEDRIPIKDNAGNDRSLEDIFADIDRVVKNIKERIRLQAPLKWKTYDDRKKEVLERGKFSVSDEINYPSITEIYNMCGGIRSGKNRGKNATMLRSCYFRLNDRYKLWVPILAETDKDGNVRNGKMGYENYLSSDHTILTEKSDHPIDPNLDRSFNRIVFMRMKDYFGRPCIKFIGVFRLADETENSEYVHIYRRIADEILLDDLKP